MPWKASLLQKCFFKSTWNLGSCFHRIKVFYFSFSEPRRTGGPSEAWRTSHEEEFGAGIWDRVFNVLKSSIFTFKSLGGQEALPRACRTSHEEGSVPGTSHKEESVPGTSLSLKELGGKPQGSYKGLKGSYKGLKGSYKGL
jgi:hypothetical protein